jgi:glycosyltransferase involved in cell wall biosynthesis
LKFLFIAQGCLPFHHRSLDERPLGGIETGIIRLAAALKDNGHEVIVATSLVNPPLSEPLYIPLTAVNDVGPVDVLVAVRDWQTVFVPTERKLTMFWTGDSYDQPQTIGMGDHRVRERVNLYLTVSNWQASQFNRVAGIPLEQCCAIGNGVHLEYFHGSEKRELHRLIYSSTPYRGLDLLPVIYNLIKQSLPSASLHVFSGYKVYEGGGKYPQETLDRFERTKQQLNSLPDCFVHGNIKQSELAREFMKSALLCYPNTFAETSCITALEAQAAGCAIVSSNLGALPETSAGASLLINLDRDLATYCRNFSAACLSILTDPMRWQSMSNAGLAKRQELSWSSVARRLLERISAA